MAFDNHKGVVLRTFAQVFYGIIFKMAKTNPFLRFFQRLKRWVMSTAGVTVTGVVSGLLLLTMLFFLIYPAVVADNPAMFCPQTHLELRDKAIKDGKDYKPWGTDGQLWSDKARALETKVDGIDYTYAVIDVKRASYYFEVNAFHVDEDYGFICTFLVPYWSIDFSLSTPFEASAILRNKDFSPTKNAEGKEITVRSTYHVSYDFKVSMKNPTYVIPTNGISKEDLDAISVRFDQHMEAFCPTVKKALTAFGATDVDGLIAKAADPMIHIDAVMFMPAYAVIISFFAGLIFCLFGATLIRQIMLHKENRLKKAGIFTPDEPIKPKGEIDELPTRSGLFVAMVNQGHMRPMLGEWFFRILGLSLVFFGSLMTVLAAGSAFVGWGEFGQFLKYLTNLFDGISSTGSFILTIAVIGIIAETRNNLRLSAILFSALAMTMYLTTCAILYTVDLAYPFPLVAGLTLANIITAILPGNIFLGLGIFAIVGFFLYTNPPKWFINRTVFRLLSLIPTSIAILSIVSSALQRGAGFIQNYWLANLLFMRDFDALAIGVLYEYAIFAFRCYLKRKYGEERLEEVMALPDVQLSKNVVLCGLVFFYVIVFYCFPAEAKYALNLPAHTFLYLCMPLFFFYKPAGKNHKRGLDVLYYILFFLALGLPKLSSLFSF